jgi:hypothetical protein
MLSETPLKMRATRYLRVLSGHHGVRDAACPFCMGSSGLLASCLSLASHLCGFWAAVMQRMFPSRRSGAARGGDRQGGGRTSSRG